MKIRYTLIAVVMLMAGVALAFALLPGIARNGANEAVKEFVLIAKGMKFHVQGEAGAKLAVRAGERVRLTIRNEESQPIAHNFVLVGLGIRTSYLQPGESGVVEFVTEREGTLLYACLLHPGLMEGQIKILP